MTEYILVILLNCGGWGCAVVEYVAFPSKEECYEALAHAQIEKGKDDNPSAIYCKPRAKP